MFNSWMKKLLNLGWSFSNIDNTWKNKTCIISTETSRIVINLSKTFLQTQSFFIVWNQKQMIFVLEKTGSRDRKLLNFKISGKTFTQDSKAISNPYILFHPLWSVFVQSSDTDLLAQRGTLAFQWIWRVQLCIQKIRLHCCFLWNYVPSLLAYSRG